ncbi:MAG: response regulator [Verrucomicrobiia bacterium]
MKLLVVDDQIQVAEIVARLAALNGWSASSRETADGIADLIRKENIHVLMLDYRLGKENGIQVAEHLRQVGLNLPIIIFTGVAADVPMEKAKSLDILAVLQKPLSVPELRRALNQARQRVDQNAADNVR